MTTLAGTLTSQQSGPITPQPGGPRQVNSPGSSTRHSGKGRRRRAAAEQRRLELQQLGQLGRALACDDNEETLESIYDGAQQPGTRRQQRRASRRASAAAEAAASREEILEEFFSWEYQRGAATGGPNSSRPWASRSASFPPAAEQEELELALAVSLSLSDSGSVHSARAIQRTLAGDLSYENLVNLEDVSLTLPASALESLDAFKVACPSSDEVCPICLGEFVEGDSAIKLPCNHNFHHSCGSEWLLQYSKCCPVCKQEVHKSAKEEATD